MQADVARSEDAAAWLSRARLDMRAARVDMDADPPLLADAAFHCQQAVEKATKAFLTWHGQPFRKTHNLLELGAACLQVDQSLEPVLKEAAALTEYATLYRYPGEMTEPSGAEADEAYRVAMQAVTQIAARLPMNV